MPQSVRSLCVAAVALLPFASAQYPSDLVGTWTTKSRAVVTGPGFYDPVNEKMFEPPLTGISYSFTDDGYYEEAYYRAIANPAQPTCPQGIIQWQHGSYQVLSNGSLILTPIGVDGRQLYSDPCQYSQSIYTHYNQSELITSYASSIDPYHNVPRLDLYQYNGAPMNVMYQIYNPPQMLPTVTLNPTTSAKATGTAGHTTAATGAAKAKRGLVDIGITHEPLNKHVVRPSKEKFGTDRWWWFGVGLTAIGSVGYFCF